MCSLKRLKNQVNVKKLLRFLNLYKYVLFYHSRKANKVAPAALIHGKSVYFQIQRVRKLASLGVDRNLVFQRPSLACCLEQANAVLSETADLTYKSHKTQKIMFAVNAQGNTGNTILVGCDSLESMQKCITGLHLDENWVSLGAIYDAVHINSKSCLQLARLSEQSVYRELFSCVREKTRLVLQLGFLPWLRLQQSLKWRVK